MKKLDSDGRNIGKTIHIKRIFVDSEHIRNNFYDITNIKGTIADTGLLQPILVRQTERGYTVIDGARRLQALKALDVSELIIGRDVIIDVDETEADMKFKQLIANVQREDINDIELGHALVALKEKHGYSYKEIAEIIGKTPHCVAAKVGLAKRLTPAVQTLVVKDWEAAKCIWNTQKCDSDDLLDPYLMNVNVIEDIARLPAELQEAAYNAVREKEMDTKEALRYLRNIKRDAEILKLADDAKGLMDTYQDESAGRDVQKYLKKIDRDVEKLTMTIKSSHVVDADSVAPIIEALIDRLNVLYAEIKTGREKPAGLVTGE